MFRTLRRSYHNIFFCLFGSLDLLIAFLPYRSFHLFANWYLLFFWLVGSFDCLLLFSLCLRDISSLCNLWILNIVCLPPSIYHWICVFHCTHILRNTQFMEEHILYWPSKFFSHFGNRCQWGRNLEGLRDFGSIALILFLSICISCSCIIGCCFAW